MKRPGFFEGVGVALAASIGGGVLFGVLTAVFAGGFVLRVLIAGLGLVYILYLLRRSGERVGRIATIVVWLAAALAIWFAGLTLPLYLAAHVGIVWLVRSLYFRASLLAAGVDLALALLGVAAARWAVLETGHLSLGLWSFFLVQALFVFLPASLRRGSASQDGGTEPDPFQQAHRVAEAALVRLSHHR